MTTNERRPRPAGPRATRNNNNNVHRQDTPSGIPATNDAPTRCSVCHRPLKRPKSVALGVGPVCWAAAQRASLSANVVGVLRFYADTMPDDPRALGLMADALDCLANAIDAEGVRWW